MAEVWWKFHSTFFPYFAFHCFLGARSSTRRGSASNRLSRRSKRRTTTSRTRPTDDDVTLTPTLMEAKSASSTKHRKTTEEVTGKDWNVLGSRHLVILWSLNGHYIWTEKTNKNAYIRSAKKRGQQKSKSSSLDLERSLSAHALKVIKALISARCADGWALGCVETSKRTRDHAT